LEKGNLTRDSLALIKLADIRFSTITENEPDFGSQQKALQKSGRIRLCIPLLELQEKIIGPNWEMSDY